MTKKVKPNKYPFLLVLVGPTASGKTDLSLRLAKKYQGCIISADSRQIYKKAKIGTWQPNGQWQTANKKWQTALNIKKIYSVQGIPHFFIDELSPNQTYSAAKFQKQANHLIHKTAAIGYLPILVGGTGLYVSSITQSYNFPPVRPNKSLRQKLNKLKLNELIKLLKKNDPKTFAVIDKNNPRRLIRALEYYLNTGQSFILNKKSAPRPHTIILGINLNPKKLELKIKQRTKLMLRQGLIKETTNLLKNYPQSILLKTIGYQEITQLLNQTINRSQVIDLISLHTRQYAKRQLTWLKKMPDIKWINNLKQAQKIIDNSILL